MAKYFGLFVVVLSFISCNVDTIQEVEETIIPTLQLDGRLPIDSNGYYHLVLDSTRNQTIHRISGKVLNTLEPTKVSWESNLYWWLKQGDTVANITKTYINYFTGQITYVNLPPIINWKDYIVPTINPASYVGDEGEINTMIAPIYRMKNDTLVVKCKVNEWDITQEIKIVLE
jgi:hypothetical protein